MGISHEEGIFILSQTAILRDIYWLKIWFLFWLSKRGLYLKMAYGK